MKRVAENNKKLFLLKKEIDLKELKNTYPWVGKPMASW